MHECGEKIGTYQPNADVWKIEYLKSFVKLNEKWNVNAEFENWFLSINARF